MLFLQIFLFFIQYIEYNSYQTKKLINFQKTYFNLNNESIIFEYSNNLEMTFKEGSIFFIFDKGYKPSTNIYLYNSSNKIEKGEIGFINYIYQSTLGERQFFEINSKNEYFKANITYYIVLYDITDPYEDYIYVVNTFDFFPLYSYNSISYSHKIEPQLNFNFRIPKHSYGYLHYQSRKDPFNVLGTSSYYYFKIVDENGTTFIDEQTNGVSNYVKLDYNLSYYIQIAIIRSRYYYLKPSYFMLSFTNYGENFLIKDDDIYLEALSPQHYSFFKNISNVNISKTILFNGVTKRGDFGECYYFIKYYDTDKFEKLLDVFPKKKEDFDSEISFYGSQYCGNFNFEIKKKNKSQKGILIGIFFESPYGIYEMDPISLTVYGDLRNKKEEEEEKQSDKNEEDKKKEDNKNNNNHYSNQDKSNNSWIYIILFLFITFCFSFGCCCKYCSCCSKKNEDSVYLHGKIEAITYYEEY